MNSSALHHPTFATDPYPVWARMRHEHPVFHDEVDDVWIVSRYDDVIAGFSDTERFSNRLYRKTLGRVFGTTLLELDGAEHVAKRKVVAPAFAPTRLDRFEPLIEQVVGSLIDEVSGRETFDIVADFSARLPGTVIVALMGFDHGEVDQFHEWYEAMMRGLWNDPELRRLGRQAHGELHDHVAPIVEQRRECPADDLLSRLIERGVEGLPAFVSVLLTAGGETTDKTLTNMWRNLLADRTQLDSLLDDPELVHNAFSETLRHSPPLVYLGEVKADAEWHGKIIPAGAELRLAVAAANRDDTVFSEPDRFDIERSDMHMGLEHRSLAYEDGSGHIAFGAGQHFCLGYALSRREATTATRMLLERFPSIWPAADLPPITVAGPSQTAARVWVAVD